MKHWGEPLRLSDFQIASVSYSALGCCPSSVTAEDVTPRLHSLPVLQACWKDMHVGFSFQCSVLQSCAQGASSQAKALVWSPASQGTARRPWCPEECAGGPVLPVYVFNRLCNEELVYLMTCYMRKLKGIDNSGLLLPFFFLSTTTFIVLVIIVCSRRTYPKKKDMNFLSPSLTVWSPGCNRVHTPLSSWRPVLTVDCRSWRRAGSLSSAAQHYLSIQPKFTLSVYHQGPFCFSLSPFPMEILSDCFKFFLHSVF